MEILKIVKHFHLFFVCKLYFIIQLNYKMGKRFIKYLKDIEDI